MRTYSKFVLSGTLVIAVVADNAGNNLSMGRMLEEKFPFLTFVNCAAHSLQLIITDMMKVEPIKGAFTSGKEAAKVLRLKRANRELRKLFKAKGQRRLKVSLVSAGFVELRQT